MTLLKELIDIPDYVDKGAFVLKLAEGVNDPEATLNNYVVTEQLVRCFDDALNFIRGALEGHTSKAAYLHGSFGSGKSHFMAVLHLILQGNPAARGIPELAPVIAKHNEWIQGRKFLLVPYHMIGARDMESGVLGGYADYIRHIHPGAPVPGVYRAEGLFQDAQRIRESMGDAAFFAQLNQTGPSGGGWGDLEARWDAEHLDAAMAAGPGSEERSRLVGDLVKQFFSTYNMHASHGEAYVPLDQGLSIISKHAKELGYDALILFLDELILWLASHSADLKFVHQECQKVAKLVEAQTPERPAPIISFVARQRDLRELIGDSVPGAERLNFNDALGWQEGRFHTITLEDRNLPAIAEKRVLRPRGPNARRELDAAFEQTAKARESVMNTLLTSEGDRAMFKKVYPFSPALIQTLIAVSSVLQRERTALKVMMQLLVDQRDMLTVGDLVPVGDLFDVIAHGDEAFSAEMALHFNNAKRLYHQKLLPALEQKHGRREELEALPPDAPKRMAFTNDDRLVKTLLLAALAPEVESLRALTPEKLAALNHGTIRTPIPGREGQEVLHRCREWAAMVGEVRVGDEMNPTISVQLTGVDTESIIEQARAEDNQGNRVRLVRAMLFEALGVEDRGEMFFEHEFLWKNTRRACELMFKNIRDLPESSLENTGSTWRLIIDWPFDEPGHGPADDDSKLQRFLEQRPDGARTLCWIPSFLSENAMKDLGMLVILQHILNGERFGQYAHHLSPADRQAAKQLLENQRSVLRNRVKNHLEAAYGLGNADHHESLDATHEVEPAEHFRSLSPGFQPQPPGAASLGEAMEGFLSQALAHDFPAAPEFETEVKPGVIKKVYEEVRKAAQAQDGRAFVEQKNRGLVRQIANPLNLGEMGYDATHFVLSNAWKNHFTKKAAEAREAITVSRLRQWMDEPKPMGLPREAQNLVILVFAEQTNRTFFLHGGPYPATLNELLDACELREQKLPSKEAWSTALQRAGHIFGLSVSELRNASNVGELARHVKDAVDAKAPHCEEYAKRLRERIEQLGLTPGASQRLATADASAALLASLRSVGPDAVIETLAAASVATSEEAMGGCVKNAGELHSVLTSTNWEIIEAVHSLPGGEAVLDSAKKTLMYDEHVINLKPGLDEAQSRATRLFTQSVEKAQPPDPPKPPPGWRVVEEKSKAGLDMSEASKELDSLKGKLNQKRRVRVTLSWVVEEEES